MCGRFTLTQPAHDVADYLDVPATADMSPRFNIAPTQPVAALRQRRNFDDTPAAAARERRHCDNRSTAAARELVPLRWGLLPHWAREPGIGARMINARCETVGDKPAFKDAFRHRRCLVLADGFYEWQRRSGSKQPYFIYMEDRRPFAFAGLWARWRPGAGQLEKIAAPGKPEVPVVDGKVESCTLLTVAPNALVETLHDRMPVIVPKKHWDTWLDPTLDDVDELRTLLLPYPAAGMRAHPVSTRVNTPANDDPACIAPAKRLRVTRPTSPPPQQGTLL